MIRVAGWGWILISLSIGLLVELIALPDALSFLRPPLLALCLMYWALEAPHKVGLGVAFIVGLLNDILGLGYLGEHALRYILLVFLVHYFRPRLRFFPIWQQAFAVMLMLGVDLIVHMLEYWMLGLSQIGEEWPQPLLGLLIWPFLYLLFDFLRIRSRAGN